MEDYLHGQNISFTLRATKGDKSKLWSDSQVYDIIFRQYPLENVCYYDFFSEYTVQKLPPKPNSILRFQKKHPGYKNRGVTETKVSFDVPMIYMPPFKDLFELEMNNKYLHIDQSIVDPRNLYALRAFIFIFSFRKIEDLNDNGRISYWEKLLKSKRQNQLYQKASEILQKIQDRHNLVQIVMGEDEIESTNFFLIWAISKKTHIVMKI